ncbi:MAG: CoA activase [Nitrospirae bacterium]|nr:CoA activase [Nitrospirota bacterium]
MSNIISSLNNILIGLDVGSTTVKAVVLDGATGSILWQDYQRHETRQIHKVLEFLQAIENKFMGNSGQFRIFITGSGGRAVSELIGAKFVQEVNAVSLAVEHNHPDAGSVIELGGQDAKIIIWAEDANGNRRKLSSMNDKCAGGTGAVIDKISAKLNISQDEVSSLRYTGTRLHPVAGKCGVFAETDINGLQKQGIPSQELMASLFEAIVQQNLSVLTRGNTLRPHVLLLGGPNAFIPALQEAWSHHIPRMWEERGITLPSGMKPEDLIYVPSNAQFYAAMGSVIYGRSEDESVGRYKGLKELEDYISGGRRKSDARAVSTGLAANDEELERFVREFRKAPFTPPAFQPGETVYGYIGIDGGSTSTKGVLLDREGELLARAYRLSKGNPIDDTREILRDLRQQVESQGAHLEVSGAGTTGYAKDMLKECFGADIALVETVAHTKSALRYFENADVIVDVGGQDIKVIFLKDGKVKDFKLNTQCSAGNGYFLQNTAERFGFNVTEYADLAFKAARLPLFHYGCAVFLESDIVNFQQQGWEREEIMAGLATVLPKNIWLYVVQEPNLRRLGRTFILQGGTQHNLAAVKAQYDFIKSRVPDAEIHVHRYTGESGAIGAALEAIRVAGEGKTSFVGLDAAEGIRFNALRDESTRCNFCQNSCQRTFIDIESSSVRHSKRYIIATCDKGTVEDIRDVQAIKKKADDLKKMYPDMSEIAAREVLKSRLSSKLNPDKNEGCNIRIGIPRTLNMYSVAPFFIAYLESAGVPFKHIILSDNTDEKMYKEGSRRGAIDACFPSKVALSHVHNLIYGKKTRPDVIFFPMLLDLPSEIKKAVASSSCPTVAATPEVIKAAFTKEEDLFTKHGIRFLAPHLNMSEPELFEQQMHQLASGLFGLDKFRNREAMEAGYRALSDYTNDLRRRGSEVLRRIESEGRVGVVVLGRPYHNDPGLNHEILSEIQKYGYPVFTVESLPHDDDIMDRLFGDEVRRGEIGHPLEIDDVWKNSYSENTNKKLWGAKYTARHPNLVAVDLSNFRCGHDSPIYAVVEEILSATQTPYFTFHDIDENRPSGSIKIRVETIHYFLQRYEEALLKNELKYSTLQETC